MVDISGKKDVLRIAVAEGKIKLRKDTVERIRCGKVRKGDVFTVSKIAAIQACKRTPEILPLCHPLPLTHVDIAFELEEDGVRVRVAVKAYAKTGVEMEALTAVSVALLCIWDMVKEYEKDVKGQYPTTVIESIKVIKKIKLTNK
ncbi:MAG: cyclic pyranopterin monophosphate synthase MoaC [Thermoprotei archaeon]|nr:MAG: cyclic pyranopterin monophosphate synthase MoaC [Thermoprotei archaeon]RLF00880.1 MAG: cyclic pyranopterin monophosphate synthase MoaC [Thermoprotei archaeon]